MEANPTPSPTYKEGPPWPLHSMALPDIGGEGYSGVWLASQFQGKAMGSWVLP